MSQKMPIEEFWKYAPDWVMVVAKDEAGIIYEYSERPTVVGTVWNSGGREERLHGIDLDLGDDWTKSKRERPVDYASMVGMFGKVWDKSAEPPDTDARFGYLSKYSEYAIWPFVLSTGVPFCHFRPMVPASRIEV